MSEQIYGPNTAKVEAFIEVIKKMTPEQIADAYAAAADAYAADAYAAADAAADAAAADAAAYAAAYDAAYDAYAAYAAYAAAYDADAADKRYRFRWYFGRAAFALAIEHLIGQHGFTQAHFDLLTIPIRFLNSFQVEPESDSVKPKYSFDRRNFALTVADIIAISESGIISIEEARYLMGFDNGI